MSNMMQFMSVPAGTVFQWNGGYYVKSRQESCCGDNAITAWELTTNSPGYFSGGIKVEPLLFSLENITEIPSDCKKLPNFSALCHHLIVSQDDLNEILSTLVEIFNGEVEYITDVWQIYVFDTETIKDSAKLKGVYQYVSKDCVVTKLDKDNFLKRFKKADVSES